MLLLQILSTKFNKLGVISINILESSPPQVNGVLTTCAGEEISLTCSHNNVVASTTQWFISPPANCTASVTHNPPNSPMCGPFVFQDVTPAVSLNVNLNSTAVATADVSMSGSVVECVGGNKVSNFSVGNISLCVLGELYYSFV